MGYLNIFHQEEKTDEQRLHRRIQQIFKRPLEEAAELAKIIPAEIAKSIKQPVLR